MKQTIVVITLFLLSQNTAGQKRQISNDSIPVFFNEIKKATKEKASLWNKDLYNAMLFVEPQTRKVFANEPDSLGSLKADQNMYSGVLPDKINIANTSMEWNGKRWAMVMLPLPANKQNRINLLAHELFHSAQPSLGFTLNNPDNNHLDKMEGRMYLRLELEALKKSLLSSSEKEMKRHLTNALTFRKYRHTFYKGSDITENELELNEGIAEFTGVIISNRNKKQTVTFLVDGINSFFNNPTFVRSFAYHTIPVYGYLLYNQDKNWNKKITDTTNLTGYLINAFHISIPADLEKVVKDNMKEYNGLLITREEIQRDEKIKKIIADYKLKFIEQPHFEIRFEKMNVSFDPRNIIPIEDKGTVYPNMKLTDSWGILNVEKGALMSPNWDKISITNPVSIEGKKITGDGWTLDLTDGYSVEKDKTNRYQLIKK
ncbi:hypothetical protein EGI16_05970 [Chryseobacterium sp. G0240]|uniref:hypothetical protein n=1 Tax=Chryseobacterium sp. G0240 TaxID=2487066 RepID=UPI000F455F5A|nr:hypothetical protein [Chryseobacterium sp. G0240]ROI05924.1 hypothetical protein EGI16_05970 [Chryseobacterium sp. G0240]